MQINRRIGAFFLAGYMILMSGCGSKKPLTTRLVTTREQTKASSLVMPETANLTYEVRKLYETYDYIGEPYISKNGYTYRKIGKIQGDIVLFGLYNMDTKKEDVPCKYDMISNEFKSSYTEEIYLWTSVPGDTSYDCGLFNMTKLREDIKCNKAIKVKNEWRAEDGNVYRWLELPYRGDIMYALFNVETLELQLYTDYLEKDNSYVCTASNGSEKIIALK